MHAAHIASDFTCAAAGTIFGTTEVYELGFSYLSINIFIIIGMIRDMDIGGRCALDFLIKLNLTKNEVQQKYESGLQSEADESTELIFVPESVIRSWNLSDSLALQLTHHAIGGLRLYYLYLKLDPDTKFIPDIKIWP